MQGYILQMQKTRKEDMIVKILTQSDIKTLYRFYGARHSIINIGRKIDFEEQTQLGFLPKLKHIVHLGYKWESQHDRYYVWQHFIKLLYRHLADVYEIDSFYFELLDSGANKLILQNPKRVVLEMYATLLKHEGRAFMGFENILENGAENSSTNKMQCFVCQQDLTERVALGRAFLLAHRECIGGRTFELDRIISFLQTQSTILLEDDEVNHLWEIFGLGL